MLAGYTPEILKGMLVTLELTFSSLCFGLLLSVIFLLGKLSRFSALRMIVRALTNLFRGLPELLVLFFIYFGGELLLIKLVGHYVEINYFFAGSVGLSLIFSAYFSETLYGAFQALDVGGLRAAEAFALNGWQRGIHIILPQLWCLALPGFRNQLLVLLKDTSIVSLIGLADLMHVAHSASASTAKPFIFYMTAGLLYLAMTSLVLWLCKRRKQYAVACTH